MPKHFVDRSDVLFTRAAESVVEYKKPGEALPRARLRLAQVVGLERLLLEGQKSRLSEAVGQIASLYGSGVDLSGLDNFPKRDSVDISQTRDGDPLFSYGLPEVMIERSMTGEDQPLQTRIGFHYLDPDRPHSMAMTVVRRSYPAVSFTQVGVGQPYTLDRHSFNGPNGIAGLPFARREPLVQAVSAVSEALCSPEIQAIVAT